MANTPQTIVNVTELLPFAWWQLKKHKQAGKEVISCIIQSPDDRSVYWTATVPLTGSSSCYNEAITGSLQLAKESGWLPKTK